jgi:hypothetical protein
MVLGDEIDAKIGGINDLVIPGGTCPRSGMHRTLPRNEVTVALISVSAEI